MIKSKTEIVVESFESEGHGIQVHLRRQVGGDDPGVQITFDPIVSHGTIEYCRELWSLLGRALDAVDGKVGPAD